MVKKSESIVFDDVFDFGDSGFFLSNDRCFRSFSIWRYAFFDGSSGRDFDDFGGGGGIVFSCSLLFAFGDSVRFRRGRVEAPLVVVVVVVCSTFDEDDSVILELDEEELVGSRSDEDVDDVVRGDSGRGLLAGRDDDDDDVNVDEELNTFVDEIFSDSFFFSPFRFVFKSISSSLSPKSNGSAGDGAGESCP